MAACAGFARVARHDLHAKRSSTSCPTRRVSRCTARRKVLLLCPWTHAKAAAAPSRQRGPRQATSLISGCARTARQAADRGDSPKAATSTRPATKSDLEAILSSRRKGLGWLPLSNLAQGARGGTARAVSHGFHWLLTACSFRQWVPWPGQRVLPRQAARSRGGREGVLGDGSYQPCIYRCCNERPKAVIGRVGSFIGWEESSLAAPRRAAGLGARRCPRSPRPKPPVKGAAACSHATANYLSAGGRATRRARSGVACMCCRCETDRVRAEFNSRTTLAMGISS